MQRSITVKLEKKDFFRGLAECWRKIETYLWQTQPRLFANNQTSFFTAFGFKFKAIYAF